MSEDDVIEVDEDADPEELPPWYQQFRRLKESQRLEISRQALAKIRKEKPDTFSFIKKYKCELVGICPRVEYAVMKEKDGDMSATYIHAFSQPTLIYWFKPGGFAFVVNVNLEYNDTVLNKMSGNKRDKSIQGFTG